MLSIEYLKGVPNILEKRMKFIGEGAEKIIFPFKEAREKEDEEEIGDSEERNLGSTCCTKRRASRGTHRNTEKRCLISFFFFCLFSFYYFLLNIIWLH